MGRSARFWVGAGLAAMLVAAGGTPRTMAATDWTTYAVNNQRTGYNPAETVLGTKNVGGLKLRWSTDLGTTITAQPLVATGVAIKSGKKDLVFVGTLGGDLAALDRTTGAVVWRKTVGAVTLGCGDVFGVNGTPVLDRSQHVIYLADGKGRVHALDEATGAERAGWPVTYLTTPTIDTDWGGLTLVGGKLYVETAGACGDSGPYRGRAFAVDVTQHKLVNTWFVNGAKGPFGGGIWGYGGLSAEADGSALYAATGNALGKNQAAALSEHVVRVTPALAPTASDGPSLVGRDVDFGATSTLFPASDVPAGCLAVMNKSGAFLVYARDDIGHGARQRLQLGNPKLADHGNFISNPAYNPKLNLLYVNITTPNKPAPSGVVAYKVGADCTLTQAWKRALPKLAVSGDYPSLTPTVANGVVYVMRSRNSVAYALDAANGQQLWSSGTQIKGLIFVAGTVVNGQLLVASAAGTVYAFAP